MNRIQLVISADLTLTTFRQAVGELQRIEDERTPVLLIAHPKDGNILTTITKHFRSLQALGRKADGAFVIPPTVNAWYHEGLEEGAWMVLGRDNFVFVEGA